MRGSLLRRKKGFTLIELLIVVGIIAIISAIGVPRLLKALYQAKDKKTMSSLRNLAIAIGIYRIDTEYVPQTADIQELVDALRGYKGDDGEIIQISPRDAWGHEFYYQWVSDDEYTLKSYGRDGGAGPIATKESFNPNADTVIISGVFIASHEGTTVVY